MPGSLDLGTFRGSGPNGSLLLGRIVDLMAIRKTNLLYILDYFSLLLAQSMGFKDRYGPYDLMTWLGIGKVDHLVNHNLLPLRKTPAIRRLAYFGDGAGKWRYIAISDWLTQLTLRPLHM